MTVQSFIDEFRTDTLKEGDKVVMHSCFESELPEYRGKVWICRTNSYIDRAKQEVVFLQGFTGCFAVKFLKHAN